MDNFIAKIQRYSFDLRFRKGSDTIESFEKELDDLLNRYELKKLKETNLDVSQEYKDYTVTTVCPKCNTKVQAYLIKPSFCMSCGAKIYPCSTCSTCVGCNE